jgi:hypothetical protein
LFRIAKIVFSRRLFEQETESLKRRPEKSSETLKGKTTKQRLWIGKTE